MRDIQKEIADKYQEFFNFMNQEHELILTIEEMDEIVFEAQRLVKNLTIPDVVGQSKQLVCSCKKPKRYIYGVRQCEKCGKKLPTAVCMFSLRNYRTNLIKRDKDEKSKKDSKKQIW